MRRAEGIVFAFLAAGEARQASTLAQGVHPIPTPGDDLVGIALVGNVPDQDIARCIEHIVDGGRQLDDSQTGPQVPTGQRHLVQHLLAQFFGELSEFVLVELAQVFWRMHPIESWLWPIMPNLRQAPFLSFVLPDKHHRAVSGTPWAPL